MGLFKKRQQTAEELEAMRAELRSLRDHLQQTDAAKVRLAERLSLLDAENERLNAQVGSVQNQVGTVANKVGSVEHEVVTVAGSIGPSIESALKAAVDARADADADTVRRPEMHGVIADVSGRLDELVATLQRQQAQIADVALVATDAAERSEKTDARVTDLGTPADWTPFAGTPTPEDVEARRQLGQLAEKVAAIDQRVDQVGLELTNQLTELSTDLDRAHQAADTTELIDRITDRLAEVTSGQEQLANEQARYAIQFREDLAELADRLRKQR